MTSATETSALSESPARPVFVSASGRRGRLLRKAGGTAGLLLSGYLIVMCVGVATGADVPATPWTGKGSDHGRVPAGRTTTPEPKGGPAVSTDGGRPAGGASLPERRSTVGPNGARTPGPASPSASAGPSAGSPTNPPNNPTASPTASPTATRPGNSHATPPAWGKHKKTG